MKKFKRAFLIFLSICLSAGLLALAGCKKDEPEKDDWFVELSGYERPADLPKGELEIEWLSPLESRRPIAIIFHGNEAFGEKYDPNLKRDVYVQSGKQVLSTSASDTLVDADPEKEYLNIVKFWENAGFSLGVFHYESFACFEDEEGSFKDFSYKILDASKNEYAVAGKDGSRGIKNANFSLLEAFASAYRKQVVDKGLDTGHNQKGRPFEVRFIGNGGGANFALAAGKYLSNLAERGKMAKKFAPNRIALTNPYWNHAKVKDVKIGYVREDSSKGASSRLTSLLTYAQGCVSELSEKGVLFEIFESDREHFKYDGKVYHGVSLVQKEGQPDSYEWNEGTDTNVYDDIVKHAAYIRFDETVTAKYFQNHVSGYARFDRVLADWYVYSIKGSDNTVSSYMLSNGERPIYDTIDHPAFRKEHLKYGMSAWTPTVYLKIMQGHRYKLAKYKRGYGSEKDEIVDYEMDQFQTAVPQVSDLSLKNGDFFMAGYVYEIDNPTLCVNLDPDKMLEGVEVRLKVLDSSKPNAKPDFYHAITDRNGFYKIKLPTRYLDDLKSSSVSAYKFYPEIYISANVYDQQVNNFISDTNQDLYAMVSSTSINSPQDNGGKDVYSLSASTEHNYFVIIKNAALIKKVNMTG